LVNFIQNILSPTFNPPFGQNGETAKPGGFCLLGRILKCFNDKQTKINLIP
jgi:hypothetical protein